MRVVQVPIGGKEYTMVHSLRTDMEVDELSKTMSPLRKTLESIVIMLNAGYAWAKKQGKDALVPPTFDQLSEDYDADDLQEWIKSMQEAMTGERHVEAKPPKKDEAGV